MIMSRFIIYKNNRRYSNIKFTDIDECKEFIKFNGDHDEAASKGWYFDFYEYPSAKFVTRLIVEDTDKGLVFTENCPEKTPRNRMFINK